jgi:hypothetical protein
MFHEMKVMLSEYQFAISQTHGCEAVAVAEIADVILSQDDGISWCGRVHVFEIHGHPTATRCSVWPETVNDKKIIIHAILHDENIKSAQDAVRSVL